MLADGRFRLWKSAKSDDNSKFACDVYETIFYVRWPPRTITKYPGPFPTFYFVSRQIRESATTITVVLYCVNKCERAFGREYLYNEKFIRTKHTARSVILRDAKTSRVRIRYNWWTARTWSAESSRMARVRINASSLC